MTLMLTLPPMRSLSGRSPTRLWAGLQFNGNVRAPVWFQRGRDVVIPQLLLLRGGGSHADQPSCEQMAKTSPYSMLAKPQPAPRSTLLWFGGHPGHGDARTNLFRLHGRQPSFVLLDSLHDQRKLDALNSDQACPLTHDRSCPLFSSHPPFSLLAHQSSVRAPSWEVSLTSSYCWVPRGQGQGDPTRHMVAIFHGCIPVFTLGTR